MKLLYYRDLIDIVFSDGSRVAFERILALAIDFHNISLFVLA